MKPLIGISLVILSLALTGCMTYSAPVIPPSGLIFQNSKAPMDINIEKTEIGMKTGTSNSISILGLIAFGDCSIKAASQNGGVNAIDHADYEYFNILGIYQRFTTIVYGN
ncbi:TRL-like family protein [Candidatus Sumerlaeota bacterium]|nr:TRL-like family protein [Candidatus Sumerlaeota bacterium]